MVVVHLHPPGSSGGVGKNCSALNLCLLQTVVLFRSQSSDIIDECLHHICLSLSLSVSLTHCTAVTLMRSRCASQSQLRHHVKWRFAEVDRVRSQYQSASRKRQAHMDDMKMKRGAANTRDKTSNANKDVTLAMQMHAQGTTVQH